MSRGSIKRLAIKRRNGVQSVTVPGKQVQETQKNKDRKAALAKKRSEEVLKTERFKPEEDIAEAVIEDGIESSD